MRDGGPPFAGPYFAAKAALDSLAVSYAGELVRFGIDTIIVVPGAYTSGTNHFANAGVPADAAPAAEYDNRYGVYLKVMPERLAALTASTLTPAKTAARSSRPSATGSGPSS